MYNEALSSLESFSIFGNLIQLTISILSIVAICMVYNKAGEHWWACFIPFYGSYKKFSIARCKELFWWSLGFGIISLILFVLPLGDALSQSSAVGFEFFTAKLIICWGISLLLLGAMSILGTICNYRLGRAFGQETAFCIGMVLLPVIFTAIIAFSSNIQCELP